MKLLKKLKSLLINLSLVLVSLVIAVAAAEVILRHTDLASILEKQYAYPQYYFVPDEQLGYDIGPNIRGEKHSMDEDSYDLFSNSYGCFDYEREVPDDYGLIVGDSFTWGYTALDKKWTTRLEELTGVFMLKCGVTGYGTKQELIKARKVIEAVGKNPKYLVVLYSSNDLHDDFVFPHRTVIDGNMVGTTRTLDMVTGEKSYFDKEELLEKYNKYVDGSLQNRLRKLRYDMITYRLYRYEFIPFYDKQRDKLKAWLKTRSAAKEQSQPAVAAAANGQPVSADGQQTTPVPEQKARPISAATPRLLPIDGRIGAYDIPLQDYLDDYDTAWYQEAIADHSAAIKRIKDYADSIGAELLFIEVGAFLTHPRFAEVRRYLGDSYYPLASDYPVSQQGHWKYDTHWNVEGNQKAGEYIYRHFQPLFQAEPGEDAREVGKESG